ncbi:unnamed protein product [Moneuplotes crassus]|uniref:Uncharacterized protein n=1 Tax=Euplotes crassus TaxID=5936 RepID=A0AAD2CW26_EUPCR|nr:unnamed protein product [Moneuplotes crassus]
MLNANDMDMTRFELKSIEISGVDGHLITTKDTFNYVCYEYQRELNQVNKKSHIQEITPYGYLVILVIPHSEQDGRFILGVKAPIDKDPVPFNSNYLFLTIGIPVSLLIAASCWWCIWKFNLLKEEEESEVCIYYCKCHSNRSGSEK